MVWATLIPSTKGLTKSKSMNSKRFLFYLVHRAKFHFHKVQINKLRENGHHVDIVFNTKDILEDLVKEVGWEYTNLFLKSRKIKGVHVYIAAGISLFLSVYRGADVSTPDKFGHRLFN